MTAYRFINARTLGAPLPGILDGKFCRAEQLPENAQAYDCHNCLVTPGFIDLHVHLRDPGQTHKEDLNSATTAAAYGGFTTVLAMPNTIPPMDSPEAFRELQLRLANARVRVLQSAAFTAGRQGKKCSDIQAIAESGLFPALSDDGSTTQDDQVMRQAMQDAARYHLPVIDHCENVSLSRPGVLHAGSVAQELGLPGQPREAEISIVRRDIALARETGCHLHLQHLSCAESVELLRGAQREGLPVSGEATPHHLLLTHEAIRIHGPNAKMAPPLREESDRQALLQAVADGTIAAIATDHAPHTAAEKAQGMLSAPFGIIGLEAALPICLTLLYHSGMMPLDDFVKRFTSGPAKILGQEKTLGSFTLGAPADVTIFDPDVPRRLKVAEFHSKSLNCPYDGLECQGQVLQVFVNGIPQLP